MSFPRLFALIAILATASAVPSQLRAGSILSGVELAPHRAVYSMALAPNSHGGAIEAVEGVMTMSMEKTCDGWIFTQDLRALFTIQDGNVVQQTAAFTSLESFESDSYLFASKVLTDSAEDIVRGDATIGADGTGVARYRQPSEVDIDLPAGTLFPISHTAWLIAEAQSGKRQASRVVFTGSDDLLPELVNAFIGKAEDADFGGVDLESDLLARKGWPLTMAFYPIESETGLPTMEMTALQLDNGVAPWVVMDFGDFATQMKAEQIEALPQPECS